MTKPLLLSLDWPDYDQQKLDLSQNPAIFLADQPWELNYLAHKIQIAYPRYDNILVMLAIRKATRALHPPFKREIFVSTVVHHLIASRPPAG